MPWASCGQRMSEIMFLLLLIIIAGGVAYATSGPWHRSIAFNAETSLRLLYQNNLNASDDGNHIAVLQTSPVSQEHAVKLCTSLGSGLLTIDSAHQYSNDLGRSLAYQQYSRQTYLEQQYFIQDGLIISSNGSSYVAAGVTSTAQLPALCYTTSNSSNPQNSSALPATNINVIDGHDNIYNGYYNDKSFRFLGIRYAEQPPRFQHTRLYVPRSTSINATEYGQQCLQSGGGDEDCFFLNIQTPYIPKFGDTYQLKPVMFWIHGGGFTGGSGADPLSDGGNLASREDIVVVSINYRLGALGFLAVPDTDVTGNFGIGDQVTALDWTIQNIATFGGDPSKITIIGESAGAASVRTLLGSPRAIGKYQRAVAMSNLGGGQTLGLDSNYGTFYSLYYTMEQSYDASGSLLVNATNCTSPTGSNSEIISCLSAANASIWPSYSFAPRYVVRDNNFVNTTELNLQTPWNGTAYVPTIFGIVHNDGASFSNLPNSTTDLRGNLTGALQTGLGISAAAAQSIITSNLFPYTNTTGNWTLDAFNVTQRVATDTTFRCIDQATVLAGAANSIFPVSYYYEFERSIAGYNPNDVPGASISPDYPHGNPDKPYFKLHGADMPWVFGNFYAELRDENDLWSLQLVSGMFAAFMRTGSPEIDLEYLRVRGYEKTLEAIEKIGQWQPVGVEWKQVRHLDYPGYNSGWVDREQCKWLSYPVEYYL